MRKREITAVMQPDAMIMNKSMGARTIPGMLLKRNPVPIRYKCPLSKIISPIYISSVIKEAIADGIHMDIDFCLSKRNEQTNTPTVTPNRIKNTAMSVADRADT